MNTIKNSNPWSMNGRIPFLSTKVYDKFFTIIEYRQYYEYNNINYTQGCDKMPYIKLTKQYMQSQTEKK